MAKQLTPEDLHVVITSLLFDPRHFDTEEAYGAFLESLAQTACDAAGGAVTQATAPTQDTSWLIGIAPNEGITGSHDSVWSSFDPDGWTLADFADMPGLWDPTRVNERLPQMFLQATMTDWRVAEGEIPASSPDNATFSVSARRSMDPAGQLTIQVYRADDPDIGLDVLIEINQGTPAVHLSAAPFADTVLHAHLVDEALHVVAAGNGQPQRIGASRYTYEEEGLKFGYG